MPSVTITTTQVQQLLDPERKQTSVLTPFGNTILEIQGDLEIPAMEPGTPLLSPEYQFNTCKDKDTVRFGLLHISEDKKHATLYIGKKQRLLGSVVELERPLGLLRFNEATGAVDLCDIMHYKIMFKDRPLPIM
ncbi:Ctf8 protein [Maudiozyma humilis]|uniref:Ctf8 protein n=1 Tax=Maudiozyma humilis TaxID=51915 RepID=A0AAV5RT96_MAUHU|nr:Ctf8 protein [Kazachstania humilis]